MQTIEILVFKSDDGSGGTTEYFKLDGSTKENYFSVKHINIKIVTHIKVGSGSDLQIFHDNRDNIQLDRKLYRKYLKLSRNRQTTENDKYLIQTTVAEGGGTTIYI